MQCFNSATFQLRLLSFLFKPKIQTIQNKPILFSFPLDGRSHVAIKHMDLIKWLPISEKFNQYLRSNYS